MKNGSKAKVGFTIAEVVGSDVFGLDALRVQLAEEEARRMEVRDKMKPILRRIERGPFRPLTVKMESEATERHSTAFCEVVIGRQPFLLHVEEERPTITRLSASGELLEDYDMGELFREFGG